MNYLQESKYRDSDSDSYSEEEEEDGELHCKNIDPALAKLMGIIIEEKVNTHNNVHEWVPPTFSGLSNSREIIPRKKENDENAIFSQIKDDVMSYRTLSPRQLDYIKNMNNDQKYEMIQIYNKTMEQVLYRKK